MGLTITYFYSLTPRQFQNIQNGWNDRRIAEQNERLILTRRLMFAALAPYKKGLTEESIWPLDIDNKHDVHILDQEQHAKDLKETLEFWERIDAARAKA